MQYCSLQHWILLSSSDTSAIEHYFCFAPAASLFLGLSSCPMLFPFSISDTFRPGRLIFQCHIFLSFYTAHEILMASILGWFAMPSSSGSRLVRTLHFMTCLSLVALHGMAHLSNNRTVSLNPPSPNPDSYSSLNDPVNTK